MTHGAERWTGRKGLARRLRIGIGKQARRIWELKLTMKAIDINNNNNNDNEGY